MLQRAEAGGRPAFSALAPRQLLGDWGKGQGCPLANSEVTPLLLQSQFAKACGQNGVKGSLKDKKGAVK